MTKLQSGQFINKRSTAGTQAMEKHLLHLTLMIVCYEYSLIRLRDSAKIQQNRALFNLPKYTSIRKTGRGHTNQGRRIRRIKSVTKTAR
jgi:hypothetical protein